MKILVVDDHALVREGLCQVLKGLDTEVEVLEAPHCTRAFELAAQHADLDLVLLDYHLPDMNGLEALDVFGTRHPELPIVMLSGSVNPQIMRDVLSKGAAGFVTKSGKSQDLLAVLRLVLAGGVYVPFDLITEPGILPLEEPDDWNDAPQLTPRQEEVLYLLLDGRSNKEISQTLQLADETTKNHVTGVLRAFGVKTRIQAVLAASRHGYTKSAPSD
ncbi:response regulator [Rhodoferax sp. UBA5149]|uniref:response regulator transcription factor n=1 Tax=Rhodoferax sp. UBA5149 TaxID=1947379 RepID=UPI0025EE376B|nr:response regulator transcription factor [Rhodoferax sp. UBA5149]